MSQFPLAGIVKKFESQNSAAVSLFRMVISLLFTCHGAATVLGVFSAQDGPRPATGEWPNWWAGVIQLAAGVLVFLGVGEVGTRVAALISSGSMAYAYFTVHQKHALWPIENGGEKSVLFCWCFLLLAITGPGVWTLSRALTGARAVPAATPAVTPVPAPTPVRAVSRADAETR